MEMMYSWSHNYVIFLEVPEVPAIKGTALLLEEIGWLHHTDVIFLEIQREPSLNGPVLCRMK